MEEDFEFDSSQKALDEIKRRFKEEEGYNDKVCHCGHTGKEHDSHSYVTYHVYCYKCNCMAFTFVK